MPFLSGLLLQERISKKSSLTDSPVLQTKENINIKIHYFNIFEAFEANILKNITNKLPYLSCPSALSYK